MGEKSKRESSDFRAESGRSSGGRGHSWTRPPPAPARVGGSFPRGQGCPRVPWRSRRSPDRAGVPASGARSACRWGAPRSGLSAEAGRGAFRMEIGEVSFRQSHPRRSAGAIGPAAATLPLRRRPRAMRSRAGESSRRFQASLVLLLLDEAGPRSRPRWRRENRGAGTFFRAGLTGRRWPEESTAQLAGGNRGPPGATWAGLDRRGIARRDRQGREKVHATRAKSVVRTTSGRWRSPPGGRRASEVRPVSRKYSARSEMGDRIDRSQHEKRLDGCFRLGRLSRFPQGFGVGAVSSCRSSSGPPRRPNARRASSGLSEARLSSSPKAVRPARVPPRIFSAGAVSPFFRASAAIRAPRSCPPLFQARVERGAGDFGKLLQHLPAELRQRVLGRIGTFPRRGSRDG